jgi:hypothetical protein
LELKLRRRFSKEPSSQKPWEKGVGIPGGSKCARQEGNNSEIRSAVHKTFGSADIRLERSPWFPCSESPLRFCRRQHYGSAASQETGRICDYACTPQQILLARGGLPPLRAAYIAYRGKEITKLIRCFCVSVAFLLLLFSNRLSFSLLGRG